MADNKNAWIIGLILGVIGAIVSAVIFVLIVLKTNTIFGIVSILCGAISGGAVGLGYKLGKGKIHSAYDAQIFLLVLTGFGLLGMLAAYFGPYLVLLAKMPSYMTMSFGSYLSLIEFDFMDVFFIVIGAYGGRLAGKTIGMSIVQSQAETHMQKIRLNE